ncbi:hypothetical protein M446_2413 [Methylobacterium sp. 4-46]|uniref:hypothetical protein n=1 Tax=unclassified Methylobacterium TaxID=2615210 RepID=UPI000165C793|nr:MULTISPECIES: hypothetical protein [Methylobacterium]ACA16869.1 hypothetical protein M446_2413 [Methylobacterium sp. 4-46]WFT82559.1 hypothetical protein QA634_12215 [Methylobacterium nodulans]
MRCASLAVIVAALGGAPARAQSEVETALLLIGGHQAHGAGPAGELRDTGFGIYEFSRTTTCPNPRDVGCGVHVLLKKLGDCLWMARTRSIARFDGAGRPDFAAGGGVVDLHELSGVRGEPAPAGASGSRVVLYGGPRLICAESREGTTCRSEITHASDLAAPASLALYQEAAQRMKASFCETR